MNASNTFPRKNAYPPKPAASVQDIIVINKKPRDDNKNHRTETNRLLPQLPLVESQLLTLKDVTVAATALTGAGSDDSIKTTGGELRLEGRLDFGGTLAGGDLPLDLLGLSLVLRTLSSLLLLGLACGATLLAEGKTVVSLVPLPEGSGIDLDDGSLGQGVGTDKFVVGRVEDDSNDTGLLSDGLAAPREVTGVDAEGTELAVTTTGADNMNTLGADTGVGGLAAELESTLLAVVGALRTGGRALVTRIARDTHVCGLGADDFDGDCRD